MRRAERRNGTPIDGRAMRIAAAVLVLATFLALAPTWADDAATPDKPTAPAPDDAGYVQVVRTYSEDLPPEGFEVGGGIVGELDELRQKMSNSITPVANATLRVPLRAMLQEPDDAYGWRVMLDVRPRTLDIDADMPPPSASELRREADAFTRALEGWTVDLTDAQIARLFAQGYLDLPVTAAIPPLTRFKGEPVQVRVHWSTIDISGEWEVLIDRGTVMHVEQRGPFVEARWVRLSPASEQAGVLKVGAPAMAGRISNRTVEGWVGTAVGGADGRSDMKLTLRRDEEMLEGDVQWVRQPDGDDTNFTWESYALRRPHKPDPDAPAVQIRFVALTPRNFFHEIERIPYAEPFWIEVEYRDAPAEDRRLVTLTWAGEEVPVEVRRTGERPTLYRSIAIHAEPMPPAEGEGQP